MVATITKLPSSRTSYYSVRKSGRGWALWLVTPSGYGKDIKTKLALYPDRASAIFHGEQAAASRQLPLRTSGERP
ncbi:hypothetical protein CO731_04976 [Aminobacter sp. MSH1]|nr:hypothetical protein CO731_04976 [Aminobacter sp. MSH1]